MLYITIGIRHQTHMERQVIVVENEDEFTRMMIGKGRHFRWRRLNTAGYYRTPERTIEIVVKENEDG